MPSSGQVHWHEGLFLQQHHLQWSQHQVGEQIAALRRLSQPFARGIIEMRLSTDALENMLVRLDRLHAIMPSGVEINFPDGAELPALDIKAEFERSSQPFLVELGVPMWSASEANTVEPGPGEAWRAKRIFSVTEIQRPDENTGANPQPMQVRKINARLLLPRDDRTDLDTLPLCRVGRATGGEDAGKPRLDEKFVPPCLALSGSSELRRLCRDLAAQVEASRRELVDRLKKGWNAETLRPRQMLQVLRLRTLNRFSGSLPTLVALPGAAPLSVYLELRELLGELAALRPDRDQGDAPQYDHDNPKPAFEDIASRIRGLMGEDVPDTALYAEFKREGEMYTLDMSDEHLTRPNEYFLRIATKDDPRAVAKLVENADQFKLMAKSMARMNIFGVKLSEERHPPLELKTQSGWHHFRLGVSESQRMWDRIKQEKQAAIVFPGALASDFVITLCMTVPGDK